VNTIEHMAGGELVPLYQRVKDEIIGQIKSGSWPTGHRVPSENQLVRQMGISRMTINRALRELTQDGYLARLQGVGTFVRERQRRSSLVELRDIADEIAERGHSHSTDIVSLRKAIATDVLAEQFETAAGTRLFHVVLVHFENSRPMQVEDRYVSATAAPDFIKQDFKLTTPTAYLLSLMPAEELEHVVRAVRPSDTVRRLLKCRADQACLEVRRRSWSAGDVITTVTMTYPGDHYALGGRHHTAPAAPRGPNA